MTASQDDPYNPEIGVRREIHEIHQSDMSRVFYAESTEGELIVVKSLDPNADDFLRDRFRAEAKILGTLQHPQIPELIEDDTAYQTPHFKMRPVMRRRDMPRDIAYLREHSNPYLAAEVIKSALDPIGYVHDEGFIHRDIKPSNLILGINGVVLADFGAAEPRHYGHHIEAGKIQAGSEEHRQARDHYLAYGVSRIGISKRVLGTLEYLSPEEVRDDYPDITSDIYSAGTSLYELLYGRYAHSGLWTPQPPESNGSTVSEDVEDELVAEVLFASQNGSKRIPENRADEVIDFTVPKGRDIPKGFIDVIERATQQYPDDRYQSAEEMQEDLERAMRKTGESRI